MRFVSVRELRNHSAQVWRDLDEQRELVITHNGKPIAIVSATDEQCFEQSLLELRRLRAGQAVADMREQSVQSGRDRLSAREVDQEIAATRRENGR